MKNTYFKIIFSIVIIWISLLGLSRLYDFSLAQNCNIKASYVQKGGIDADILINGPCEPLWMISPKLLDRQTGLKSYNLALSHSDFADNYLHLHLYLKNNKAPQFLFLFVTPESMDGKYNTFHSYRFAPFMNDPVIDSVIRENDSIYYKWAQLPFMKYAYYSSNVNFEMVQGLKHYLTNRTTPWFADGFEPPFKIKWDNHLEEFIKLYPHGYLFKWNDLREKYLRKSILLAQQHGIQIILYESPILKEALAHQPNRNEVINNIQAIAKEYNVTYVQFQEMEITKSRTYYTSALNTTLEGSFIFTDSLGRYIKNNLLDKE